MRAFPFGILNILDRLVHVIWIKVDHNIAGSRSLVMTAIEVINSIMNTWVFGISLFIFTQHLVWLHLTCSHHKSSRARTVSTKIFSHVGWYARLQTAFGYLFEHLAMGVDRDTFPFQNRRQCL